ncbi:MAG TPA: GFA family protein [Nevskia sp.]|jgi:hypothetical protein|nr:GFA family protein [Nevskia sp.]
MTYRLEGSCQCGSVRFTVESHAPYPYQLCYCSICRKTGGAGYAINLSADAATLQVQDHDGSKRIHHARLHEDGKTRLSTAERHFCGRCGSHLWLFSPEWPELLHPLASAIDSELPLPPDRVHMMLGSKAGWVRPDIGAKDRRYDEYPELSIEEWHRRHGLWSD